MPVICVNFEKGRPWWRCRTNKLAINKETLMTGNEKIFWSLLK